MEINYYYDYPSLHFSYFPLYRLQKDFFHGLAEKQHHHHHLLFNPKPVLQGTCSYPLHRDEEGHQGSETSLRPQHSSDRAWGRLSQTQVSMRASSAAWKGFQRTSPSSELTGPREGEGRCMAWMGPGQLSPCWGEGTVLAAKPVTRP